LDTLDKRLAWRHAQDLNVAFIDMNPSHHPHPNNDEHTVHMNRKSDHAVIQCPCSQAKELFPAMLAWHEMWTGGGSAAHPVCEIPRLAWTVACHWDHMTAPLPPPSPDPNDLNIRSNSCDATSNKKMKLTHVEARCGDKLDESRKPKALIDTGSSGCVILNEFTKGAHHRKSEVPQQWMTKGGMFQTNGVCPARFYLPEFSTQECAKWKFHVDDSKHVGKNRHDMILGRDLLEQLPPDVKFSDGTVAWQEVTVPVKNMDELDNENVNEIVEQCHETGHLGKKADLHAITSKCVCLFLWKKDLHCLNCHFDTKTCSMARSEPGMVPSQI
jgi:hypothetical protein